MCIRDSNCTHLTSFRSEEAEEAQSSVSSFAETAASVQDLTGSAVQKNQGILRIMFCLWLFAGSLYTYDMAGKRRDEAYEIFCDEVYEKFKVLKATMFDPLFHSNIRKRIENKSDYLSGGAAEELREAEIPSEGMLYSEEPKCGEAVPIENSIDKKSTEFSKTLTTQTKVFSKVFGILKEENQALSLFFLESYKREIFTKRSITFLVEVLSLLFIACLYAPFGTDAYICPDTQTTNGAGGGLLQPPEGSFLDLTIWYFRDSLSGTIANCLWLWPGAWFLFSLFTAEELLTRTRSFHEARFFELKFPHYLMTSSILENESDGHIDVLIVALNLSLIHI